MKALIYFGMIFVAVFLLSGCPETDQPLEPAAEGGVVFSPETPRAQISYVIGVNMGMSLESIRDEVDLDMIRQGLEDSFLDRPLQIAEEEAQALMTAFGEKIQNQQQQQRDLAEKENLEAGRRFLEENRSKEGVVTTDSGLQYRIVQAGTGARPKASDIVSVHYRGTMIDGTEFDSSYNRGEPSSFPVSRVIPGWVEGLQLMPTGSQYRFFIPSELAYGPNGAGNRIGPNEVLIFEVELIDIVNPE